MWKRTVHDVRLWRKHAQSEQRPSSRGALNFATLWDFVDTANREAGLLVSIEGPQVLIATRLLTERATLRFPNAKVAAASSSEEAWESFINGSTLPVSPFRPLGRFIGLEPGRPEEEVRSGYDLIFRAGSAKAPDVRILLGVDGGPCTIARKDAPRKERVWFPQSKLTADSSEAVAAGVDILLEALSLPANFGAGPISRNRPLPSAKDLTHDELQICSKLLAWYWPIFSENGSLDKDLKGGVVALLREKLDAHQMQTLKTLLNDAREKVDFFSLVAIAKEL